MRVGTMFLGRVEPLVGESIQTKFFVLGVPIAPLTSFYATSESGNGVTGIEIPVHGTSVVAGYLRIGLFGVAVLSGLFGYLEHSSYDPQWGLFGLAGAATLAWLAAMFFLGRLSPTEKRRRLVLRAMTGLGAPPGLLPDDVRGTMKHSLEEAWLRDGTGRDWRAVLRSGDARAGDVALLFALAEYDGDPTLVELAKRGLVHGAARVAAGATDASQ